MRRNLYEKLDESERYVFDTLREDRLARIKSHHEKRIKRRNAKDLARARKRSADLL